MEAEEEVVEEALGVSEGPTESVAGIVAGPGPGIACDGAVMGADTAAGDGRAGTVGG